MKSSLKLFTIVIPLAGSLLFPWIGKAQAPTPPYVVMPGGNQVQVERILARPDGSLVVTRNGQPVNLTPEQYERAVGERPPELARAEELMAGGEADQAEDLLEEVLRKAAFQSWDGIAAARLAEMRLKAGNPIGARRPLDTLRSRYGDNTERFFPGGGVHPVENPGGLGANRGAGGGADRGDSGKHRPRAKGHGAVGAG